MEWFKAKWKFIVGIGGALIGALLFLLRINSTSRKQKEILKKANESHRAELDAVKDAEKKRAEGLEKISTAGRQEVDKIHRDANKKDSDLRKQKEDFARQNEESDTLAKDLAEVIGADFVESDDD